MTRLTHEDVKATAAMYGIPVLDLMKHSHKIVLGFEPRNAQIQNDANDLFGPTHRVPKYVSVYITMRKRTDQMPAIP